MQVEKNISFFMENQFPAIYREYGPELVDLVTEYYKFMETETNQSTYNLRRMFEYRDVATTLDRMLIFFKNMFLADLPFKEDVIRVMVRNILDLYRRKGTSDGIKIFFQIFFASEIEVYYPSKQMLKVSDSNWITGTYLQMVPNSGVFVTTSGTRYSYIDLPGKNIFGSISGARAAVSRVNIMRINGTPVPIIYIDQAQGNFRRYDDLIVKIDGEIVSFGVVAGSLNRFIVDTTRDRTEGYEVGDSVRIQAEDGFGATGIVSQVVDKVSGEVSYTVTDGGFGYTIDNTRLIVSDTVLILDNSPNKFILDERIRDDSGNTGTVIGQDINTVGIKMNAGQTLDTGAATIETLDRSPNVTFTVGPSGDINRISGKNTSSPGPLYPDTSDINDVKVESLSFSEVVSLITDVIADFVNVPLNSANYNTVPPASQPMSGTADPVTINTPLDQAFDITDFTIGSINAFENINPGSDYTSVVYAIARDSVFSNFDRRGQIVSLDIPGAAGIFSVGDIITEQNTGKQAKVIGTNSTKGFLKILPYSYYGFTGDNDISRRGTVYAVTGVSTDYGSRTFGDNAVIDTNVSYAIGVIEEIRVVDSGFGYGKIKLDENGNPVPSETFNFIDEDGKLNILQRGRLYSTETGEYAAQGGLYVNSQGSTEGFWTNFSSHLNGYQETSANNFVYYDSTMRIQDSDYFQEYSYLIKSEINRTEYEKLLKETVHLAGTKMFDQRYFRYKKDSSLRARNLRIFNDDGIGSPFDVANSSLISSDITNLTVDSEIITSDNDYSEGPAPGPYSITPVADNVDEGSNLVFSVSVPNWPNGTVLNWRIGPTPERDSDFQFQAGNIVMVNGSGSFSITPVADSTTEGDETFFITLRTVNGDGPIVYTSPNYTINDTSTS